MESDLWQCTVSGHHSFFIIAIYTLHMPFAIHYVTCTYVLHGTMPSSPTPVQADSIGPRFQSLFASTQQSIDVSLSLLRLQLHRESLINLLAIAQGITDQIKLVSCTMFDAHKVLYVLLVEVVLSYGLH